ncbi:group II intron reverse transcriptase domain-containing protein [bacterium]|nr:group II intron reverse transcriptase domain-containing protein [bacterium]
MKRTGCLFKSFCSFGNLYFAFKKAFRAAGASEEACRFCFNLETELLKLKDDLEKGAYSPARYRYFKIFDPKERTISVAPFRDRVAHHALIRVIEPLFDMSFIYDSYATRKGKGTHRAIRRAQYFLRKNACFLKMDVAKYFDSIDQDILLAFLRRKIKDNHLLELMERIVRNSDTSRGIKAGKGLPIGNLTSQFFANVYLDALDHFIKEKLDIKYYIRYMDDMVIFSDSKDYLKKVLNDVADYLADCLKLDLNPRSTFLNSHLNGLPFLGFRIFSNTIRVKNENLRRIGRRIRRRESELKEGIITEERFIMCIQSMFAHLGFADSLMLRRAMLS